MTAALNMTAPSVKGDSLVAVIFFGLSSVDGELALMAEVRRVYIWIIMFSRNSKHSHQFAFVLGAEMFYFSRFCAYSFATHPAQSLQDTSMLHLYIYCTSV